MRILLLAILFIYAIKSQEPITVNLTKVYNDGMKILDENGNFIPNPDYVYDHSKQRELASTYASSITNQAQLSYYGPLYFFNNAGSTSSSASINILSNTQIYHNAQN